MGEVRTPHEPKPIDPIQSNPIQCLRAPLFKHFGPALRMTFQLRIYCTEANPDGRYAHVGRSTCACSRRIAHLQIWHCAGVTKAFAKARTHGPTLHSQAHLHHVSSDIFYHTENLVQISDRKLHKAGWRHAACTLRRARTQPQQYDRARPRSASQKFYVQAFGD